MLLEMLFVMSCKDAGNQQACEKAMEAGTKQYKVYQSWEQAESSTKKLVTDATGSTVWAAAGMGYKTYKDKGITYSFKPKDVFVDKITTKAGVSNGSVNLEWKF